MISMWWALGLFNSKRRQQMTFCTKNPVSIQTLRTITVPEETETYKPGGHDWLALQVKEIGTAYLGECRSSG